MCILLGKHMPIACLCASIMTAITCLLMPCAVHSTSNAHADLNVIFGKFIISNIDTALHTSGGRWFRLKCSEQYPIKHLTPPYALTHWGGVTHICVVKLTIIGSDNGLSPDRRQVIIWTNAELLLIGPLGTNVIEILIGIQTFSFKKMHLKMSSAKWRSFVSASMS